MTPKAKFILPINMQFFSDSDQLKNPNIKVLVKFLAV